MRILHCCSNLLAGGAERQLVQLSVQAAASGDEVHIAYLAGRAVPDELAASRVELHPLAHRSTYDPMLVLRLRGLIKQLKPDIVQTWLLQMDVVAGLAAIAARTPWIIREPSSALQWPDSAKTRLRIAVAKGADAVVSNSRGGDDYWSPHKPEDRRYIVGNALPLEAMENAEPASKQDLGVPPGSKLIFYAGRFDEGKNMRTLVQALASVVRDTPAIAMLLGDGPVRPELIATVDAWGLAPKIRMPGLETNIWPTLRAADLFVSVSRFEGRPNSVLEAMACGVPIVVSDIPAHREILDDTTAVFTSVDDADAIARAIRATLGEPSIAAARAAKAKLLVGEARVSQVVNRYREVYAEVIARRRRR